MINNIFSLAIDVMGADKGPEIIIAGADKISNNLNINFKFVGDKKLINPLIQNSLNLKNSEVIHTDEFVNANEKPSKALRMGNKTSMRMCVDLLKNKEVNAVVSAGNTGALMSISYVVLRTINGISRPGMVAFFPTLKGQTAMLDLGANIDCDSKNLVDFAIMGSAFSKIVLKLKKPTVAILNVGEETQKGNTIIHESSKILSNPDFPVNYVGFVEGNDIAEGKVDVIITDGFSGNIAIKTAEGTAMLFSSFLQKSFNSSLFSKIGYLFAKTSMIEMKKKFDPTQYNGAVMLGLNGIVVKSHGGTNANGFSNAIAVAYKMVKEDFIGNIKKIL